MAVINPWSHPAEWSNGIPPEIFPPDAEVLTLLLNQVKRQGMVVLEVGSWVGNGSTRVIAETIRNVGGALYCVDTWAGSDNVDHHREYRDRYNTLFTVFSDNVHKYNAKHIVKPLVMPSVEASRLFPDESLDLIFIDGNHGYSHAKDDMLAWLPKVRSGGILCGHDCDASYQELDACLKAEIESQCEDDVFTNLKHPGPPAFHAGVVKAVDEMFGGKAKLWFKHKPSTIWSYFKMRSMLAQFQAFFQNHHPFSHRRIRIDRGELPAPTPWPDEATEGEGFLSPVMLESRPREVC